MTHDYAKKNKVDKKTGGARKNPKASVYKRGGAPRWLFFLLGICSTLFVQFVYQLTHIDTPPSTAAATHKPATDEKSAHNQPQKPEINFYDSLPAAEVKVSTDVAPARDQKDYHDVLQAGTFATLATAEIQRDAVIRKGFPARIDSYTNSNGIAAHRILVGPFSSRSSLNAARSSLFASNIPTLQLRRK